MASEIRVNQIQSRTGVSTISFTETGPIISGVTTITGDLDVTGLVSYDDVTNIDSVGVVTARAGVNVTGGSVGIGTDNPSDKLSIYAAPNSLVFGAKDTTRGNHIFQLLADNPTGDGELRLYKNSGSGTHEKTVEIASSGNSYFTGGNIGINDTTPDATLSVGGSTAFIDVGAAGGNRGKIGYSSNDLYFGTSSSSGEFIFKNNVTSTDNPASSGTERLRITSSGDLFVAGTGGMNTTQLPNGSTINVNGTSSNDGLSVIRYSTGYGAYGLNIGRSKSDTIGTNAAVTNGNDLGHISFYGADGTDFNMAAQITSQVDGTPSDGTDMPGRLVFKTSSDGSATPTERLRIQATGQISIKHHNTSDQLELAKSSGFGYDQNTYRVIRIGKALGVTGSTTYQSLAFNYDPSGNSSGSFAGHGAEMLVPNHDTYATTILQPKSNNNGYNTLLSFGPTGEVRKPSQPLAIIGTTQNNWSPSTGDTLPFDYSNTNRGNHYNTSNYTFTCPVAGDYMVILRISRKGWCGDLELAKNNSQYARLELRVTGRNASNAADWQAWCYEFIVPCAANDTLKWKAPSIYTGTGGGNYLLDGYNHIYYDSVTYYLMG